MQLHPFDVACICVSCIAEGDAWIAEMDRNHSAQLRSYYRRMDTHELCVIEAENPGWTRENSAEFFEVLDARFAKRAY